MKITWRSSATPTDYEQARVGRVFNNRRPDRKPLAIAEPTTEAEIVEAVKLAISKHARVSVRAGGHSWAAWSVRDDAVLIDLGQYHLLEVDEKRKVAVASPSTTGRVLNGKLIKDYGLMFAGGHCPDVGIGGFLLQGGMGWNCRVSLAALFLHRQSLLMNVQNWGWACEQVLAVDVVTATGNLIHCNATQNSEYYWAARGSGPGFPGVITKFHLQLRDKPKIMRTSGYFYPKNLYRKAFQWMIDLTPGYDADTEITAVGQIPPGMDEVHFFCLFVVFKDTVDEAEAALKVAHDSRPAGAAEEWFNKEDSMELEYENQGNANPKGHRYACDNAYIKNDADVPAVLEDAFLTLPDKKAFTLWYAMNPCSRRTNLPDMALSMQSDHYFALYTVWEDPANDEKCIAWVQNIMKKVERHSVGAYLGDADFQRRKTKFWADQNGKKLTALRKKLDPQGLICGYLDEGDRSGINGLPNEHEWEIKARM